MVPLTVLPFCRWRGPDVAAGRFACGSPHLIVGSAGVQATTCLACPYANAPAAKPVQAKTSRVCKHLGTKTRETVPCEDCTGKPVQLFLYICYHPAHDKTTLAACQHCQEREV
jgi:hypothetical protein